MTEDLIKGLATLVGSVFIYLLPLIIATSRQHHNAVPISFLNIFLGWTVLGWIIAFLWAATSPPPTKIIIRQDSEIDIDDDEIEEDEPVISSKREHSILPKANLPDYLFDKKHRHDK